MEPSGRGLLLRRGSQARAESKPGHRQQIAQVVGSFRKAIIGKDQDSFTKPFLREKTTWSSAFMDAGVDRVHARIRAKDPSTPRRRKDFNGKPREFIEVIVKDPAHPEEAFSNIRIDTDGEVARVWFDYSFMVGNYKQDSGKDAWHLLRTDAGRKIASVVWSMDSNPAPPPPNARR